MDGHDFAGTRYGYIWTTFAYALASRFAQRGSGSSLDLASLRVALIGGERIMPSTLKTIYAGLGPAGSSWSSLRPAYGMAEVGLAAPSPLRTAGRFGINWTRIVCSGTQRRYCSKRADMVWSAAAFLSNRPRFKSWITMVTLCPSAVSVKS